jgi:hypothetical protein
MAYTTTTKELFDTAVTTLVKTTQVDIAGPVFFHVEGAGGGSWTVDFKAQTVTSGFPQVNPKVVVRAFERDFMALVEGRMSADDGLLTKRLHVAGDVAAITHLMDALAALRPRAT